MFEETAPREIPKLTQTISQLKYRACKSLEQFDEFLKEFRRIMCLGLTFERICCERLHFENGVTQLSENTFSKLDDTVVARSISAENLTGSKVMWHYCYGGLRKGEKPSLSTMNGLTVESIPEELNLSDFEMQLIAKDLLFMKNFKLLKSRVPALKDKLMNLPLTCIDLQTTAQVLPRSLDDSLLVNVQFKRYKDFMNVHSEALVRPHVLLRALTYLQLIGNPFYRDVVSNQIFAFDEAALINMQTEKENDDHEAVQVDKDDCLDTCLTPHNAAAHVFSNYGVVRKVLSETIIVAPGENKLPTNWLSNVDFEAKSFPGFVFLRQI